MEKEHKILKELKRLRVSFYLTILVIVAAITILIALYYKNCCIENYKSKEVLTEVVSDYSNSRDSVNELKLKIYSNRKIEDSLQNRIIKTLDSLEILEGKLRVMHNNSGMANEVLNSVLDSIDFFRSQTEILKSEIKRINRENEDLLSRERIENSTLQNRIKQFEKRLKAVYGINIKVTTYFNGHNSDSKLIESNKAKKVNEIKVDFNLTRAEDVGDVFSVVLMKAYSKIAEKEKIAILDRTVTTRFEISDLILKPGKYKIVIYHENSLYGIIRQAIGESYFELN